MAWNRTSLSMIGVGFTIYQFFQKVQEATHGANAPHPEAPRNLGLALILVGTAATIFAVIHYLGILRYMHRDEFKPNGLREGLRESYLALSIAVFSALIGITTTLWILFRV
jgi:putative membrane protein